MQKTILATVARQRGDARLHIESVDLGAPGRRINLLIQRPHHVEDEIEGRDNWFVEGSFPLRLAELDDLIAKLQAARAYLV